MRKLSIIIIIALALQLCLPVFADGLKIGTDIGDVLSTDIVAQIDGYEIPSCNVDNSMAIRAADLKYYGFDVYWDAANRAVIINRNYDKVISPLKKEANGTGVIGEKIGDVLYTDIKTYLDGELVQSFNMNGSTLIYFRELKRFGDLEWNAEKRMASLKLNQLIGIEIEIKDPVLEKAIRDELGIREGIITTEDAENLHLLNIYDENIESLEGIENFVNLSMLTISKGNVSDLSPLSTLVQMSSISIWNNNIVDITPLKNMSKLQILHLYGNKVKDITPLKNLLKLKQLGLGANNIDDIKAISGLKMLEYLNLEGNAISDITVVKNMSQLRYLGINGNKVRDISVLKGLKKLEYLDIGYNMIKDISAVEYLTELNHLYAEDNPILDAKPLESLSKLESLGIYETDEIDKAIAISDKLKEILSTVIRSGMSDYEKELALHDYIVNNTRYDYQNYLDGTIPDDSYWPYGILINNTGVCNGYAYTMKLLLNLVDIECMVISGEANGGGHAWNIVKLGNEYYHLDVTWNDPVNWYYYGGDILSYDYFNITDEQMAKDHTWNKSLYPECNGVLYRYQGSLR